MNQSAAFPLRLLATDSSERFQLSFAEQAVAVLEGFSGVRAQATGRGVVISGATERDLLSAGALLQAASSTVQTGAPEVVYQAEGTLEPYFRVLVTTPIDDCGIVMGDLSTRRGEIESFNDSGNGRCLVSARAPVSEMLGFDAMLANMTRNSAVVEYEFAGYERRRKNDPPSPPKSPATKARQ